MARVSVDHTIGDLAQDMRKIATGARSEMVKVVREAARVGNEVAKDNARRTSGAHAKKYPGTFRPSAVRTYFGFGGGEITAEYGPLARGQGMLASYLERGTRNNPPHNDLAKSADLIGPAFANEARDRIGDLFWPGAK